jgi:hypothetical protein
MVPYYQIVNISKYEIFINDSRFPQQNLKVFPLTFLSRCGKLIAYQTTELLTG